MFCQNCTAVSGYKRHQAVASDGLMMSNAAAQVHIHKAQHNLYAAVIDNKLALKLGPGEWSPKTAGVDVGQKAWLLAMAGNMFTIWEAAYE